MSDESTTIEAPEQDVSTVVQEEGDHNPAPEHKPGSMDDAISRALDQQEAKAPEPKEAKEEKPAKEKPAKEKEPVKDAEEGDEGDDSNTSGDEKDGGEDEKPAKPAPKERKAKVEKDADPRHVNAPANFLPRAKEEWRNVPHAVRGEVYRAISEAEQVKQELTAKTERYERIRDFDELAQSNGRDLRDSLMRVHEIENELQRNPVAGLNRILMEAGPRKADGQPYSLFEVATAIVQQGQQGYQRMVAQQPQQQQQQPNPEVEMLRQQIQQMQLQQVEANIIEPFKRENPRYEELRGAIEQILKSGMVPSSLDPLDRLGAAYDMAVRLNPSADIEPDEDDEEPAKESRSRSVGASRSIKGSPPSGGDGARPRRKTMSRDEAISAAMAALR